MTIISTNPNPTITASQISDATALGRLISDFLIA